MGDFGLNLYHVNPLKSAKTYVYEEVASFPLGPTANVPSVNDHELALIETARIERMRKRVLL